MSFGSDERYRKNWIPLSIRGNAEAEKVHRESFEFCEAMQKARDEALAAARKCGEEMATVTRDRDAARLRCTQVMFECAEEKSRAEKAERERDALLGKVEGRARLYDAEAWDGAMEALGGVRLRAEAAEARVAELERDLAAARAERDEAENMRADVVAQWAADAEQRGAETKRLAAEVRRLSTQAQDSVPEYVAGEAIRESAALRARCLVLEEALREAAADLQWMSGSSDFSPEGHAHVGWVKVRENLDRYTALLAAPAPEEP